MLESLIRTCLRHRALVLVAAAAVLTLGIWKALTLPKDVLPELTRPTVTLLAPVPGLAPEEMESSPGRSNARSRASLGSTGYARASSRASLLS
jgi:Cu/Ag efflux pump CusA